MSGPSADERTARSSIDLGIAGPGWRYMGVIYFDRAGEWEHGSGAVVRREWDRTTAVYVGVRADGSERAFPRDSVGAARWARGAS